MSVSLKINTVRAHENVLKNFSKDKYVCVNCGESGSMTKMFNNPLYPCKGISNKRSLKQTNMHLIEDKTENNVIDMATAKTNLSIGGNGGGEENWLSTLEKGTVFVARRKNTPRDILVCDLYAVMEHKGVVTNLLQKVPDGRQADFWFKTLDFSRNNDLIEIIAEVKLEYDPVRAQEEEALEETEVDDDGSSDRTV